MAHRRRHRTASLAVAAALVASVVAGCSGSSSPSGGSDDGPAPTATTADPTTTTVDGGATAGADGPYEGADFYAPPDPLPEGEHGTLLRYQPIDVPRVPGARSYRIMYLSESIQGDPVAVTGTALVPEAAAPEDGRGLLTIAHGTTGIADRCAPSRSPVRTELSLTAPMIREGSLVAMSDYEGLGTPGRHPYLVGESEGRGVLDAITAAGALPNADPGTRLGIAGYSQGGHGALWADQLAADWTPQYEVVGTFAGAPASEIDIILNAAPRLPSAGFAYMMIAGIAAANPDADLSEILTPAGIERLDDVDDGCVRDVLGSFVGTPAAELVRADGPTSEPWKTLAKENTAGQVATDDPLLVIHSRADATVPLIFSEILEKRLCALGRPVERRLRDEGEDHVAAAIPAYRDATTWLLARFGIGDAPVVDDCATR
jgi:hypothetical protein